MTRLSRSGSQAPIHGEAARKRPSRAVAAGAPVWLGRAMVDGQEIAVTGRDDLLRNKRSTGRPRDLADAEELEKFPT